MNVVGKNAKCGTICVLLILLGCGTWIGNPKKPPGGGSSPAVTYLQIKGLLPTSGLLAATSPIAVTDGAGQKVGSVVLSDVRLALGEINLKSTGQADRIGAHFSGPYTADLLNNHLSPRAWSPNTVPGTYQYLQMVWGAADQGIAATSDRPGVAGVNFIASGVFQALGGSLAPKPLRITLNMTGEVKISLTKGVESGLNVSVDDATSVLVDFALGHWFDGVGTDLLAISAAEIAIDDLSTGSEAKVRDLVRGHVQSAANLLPDPYAIKRSAASVKLSGFEPAAELVALARVSADSAKAAALARIPEAAVAGVELGNEGGFLVYEVDLSKDSRRTSVAVDAGTGVILYADNDQDEP